MKYLFLAAATLLSFGCASPAAPNNALEARGLELVEARCSVCHATGRAGASPNPEAPVFRQLSERYPVQDLEEALAEGINVGHPAMPQFAFPPEDVDAIVAYLQSIQTGERDR